MDLRWASNRASSSFTLAGMAEAKFFFSLLSLLIKTPINIPVNGTPAFSMERARTFIPTATDTKASGKTV